MTLRPTRLPAVSLALASFLLAASVATADPVRVSGSVDAAGAAASVRLLPFVPTRAAADAWLDGGDAEPDPVAAARTGGDGGYVLTAPSAGLWRLQVAAAGRVPLERRLRPLIDPLVLPTVELPPDAGAAVRVLDPAGEPLAGVRVEVSGYHQGDWRWNEDKGWRPAPRRAVSDAAGRLRLPRLAGEQLTLTARHPGLPPVTVVLEAEDEAAVVRFAAGVERPVRVVDEDGEALSEVIVRLAAGGVPLAESGDDGSALLLLADGAETGLELLAADGWRAAAELPAWRPRDDEAEAAGAPVATLTLPPAVRAAGRVIDAASEVAVAGAHVWLQDEEGEAVASGPDGRWALLLPADADWLQAVAPGYRVLWRKTGELDASQPHRLALEPADLLAGRVVDPLGEPVAGARVRVRRAGARFEAWSRAQELPGGETGRDGAFALRGLLPERDYELRVEAHGFAPAEAVGQPAGEAVEVVLEVGRGVVGRVLDAYATPLAGARVRLFPLHEDGTGQVELVDGERVTDHEVASAAGGRFAATGLPAGLYDLEVLADGWAPLTNRALKLPRDGDLDLGDLVLEPGVRLDGRVEDLRGRPIAGAEIRVDPYASQRGARGVNFISYGGPRPRTASDDDGRFAVEHLAEGEEVQLGVRHDDYLHADERVVPGGDEVLTVRLRPAGRVFGEVVSSDGRAVPGARVEVSVKVEREGPGGLSTHSSNHYGSSDDDGGFSMSHLGAGELSVLASAAGYAPGEAIDLRIEEGQEIGPLRLVLALPAVLTGQVVTPGGEPAPGIPVQVRAEGHSQPFTATSDEDGAYRVADLPPGRVEVRARDPLSGEATERSVDLGGGERRLDLVLEGRPAIAGRVVDREGRPVGQAFVQVVPRSEEAGESSFQQLTGSDGRFLATLAAPGLYAVHARAPGGVGRLDVEVGSEPVTGVEVELSESAGEIAGRVLGLDADEVTEVTVEARPRGTGSVLRGRAAADGSYRVPSVPPGDWHLVARHPPSGRSAETEAVVDSGGVTAVDLVFPPEVSADAELTGRILAAGAPMAGAWLRLDPVDPASGARRESGETAADGSFRFEALVAGDYRLTVGGVASPALPLVRVGDGQPLVLDLPTVAVAGRVVTPTGLALRDARLRLLPLGEEGMSGLARSDGDGRFVLPRVVPGSYRLTADPPFDVDRAPHVREVEIGARGRTGLEIVLE